MPAAVEKRTTGGKTVDSVISNRLRNLVTDTEKNNRQTEACSIQFQQDRIGQAVIRDQTNVNQRDDK